MPKPSNKPDKSPDFKTEGPNKSPDFKTEGPNKSPDFVTEKIYVCDYSINQDDLYMVADAELDDKGLVDHHISSANDLYSNGIPQIITQVFKVEKDIANQRDSTPEDKLIENINVLIKFTDVFINRPTTINYYSGKEEILYPNVALLEDKTYSANLRVNASITATAYYKNGTTKVRTDTIENFKLCRVPVAVRSILCNTYECSRETLMRLHEDPTDPGGYFIINGNEWVVDCIENILFNQIRIFKNEGYSKEVMRVEFVSKPGDTYQNSDYFLVRLLNDNQLTCEIVRNHLKGIQMPFYILFRMLGWSSDKEMFDNILYGYENDISKNMLNFIIDSINAKYSINGRYIYNQIDAVKLIVDELKNTDFKYLDLDNKPDNYHLAISKIFNILDCNFLPHVGLKPEDRPKKLRYLGLIIRKLFLVKMGNMEATDRDSYKSKRVHAAGMSYAKTFKTYFNASIIQQIKRRLVKDFRAMPFSQVDLAASVKSSVYGADFERSIIQAITSGNKSKITVNKKSRINRLSSQLLDRKNQIAIYSTLRQVTTTSAESSKQSERASEMRRVHMSFLGYICCIHSSDGEKVGINKQLAIFASILGATSSEVIKEVLLKDALVMPLDTINTSMIYEQNLRNVYVNGEWIGCTKDSLELVKKYRMARRGFKINPLTTIHWDNTQDEALFWVDMGRVTRPLIIVYNNKRDPEMFPGKEYAKTKQFIQGIGVDKKVIEGLRSKTIDIDYLVKNNLIEYITPEEQENCYVCPFFDRLREEKNNELNEFTHCDIPQSILGLTALTGPYASHNQPPRITFQTSQCRQTCGVFALNWPYRCDKDTFLQYICETPLIKTVASKYIFPNGSNAIVAIMCYSGYNQEDSIVVSQGAVDRGLFNGSKFTFYKTELEQREEFGSPDIAKTADIKAGSYDKLKNGIIEIGTKIVKGDAIIGKLLKTNKTTDETTTSDRSLLYKENEDAIVHNVIINRNENDEKFCKVAMRKIRPIAIGDKFCLTGDHEVLTTNGWKNIKLVTMGDRVATLNQITNEIEFQQPTDVPSFKHTGLMYSVKARGVDLITTLNHKMYVRKNSNYELIEANEIYSITVNYKKDGLNKLKDIESFTIKDSGPIRKFNMDAWLEFIGLFISNKTDNNISYIGINTANNIIKDKVMDVLKRLNILPYIFEQEQFIVYIYDYQIAEYLNKCSNIPEWCFSLSKRQSCLLLNAILLGSQTDAESNIEYRTELDVASEIQIIAFMAEKAAEIKIDKYNTVVISDQNKFKEPLVGGATSVEDIFEYTGMLYCLTVPNHVFLTRRNFTYVWTGNSSRAGLISSGSRWMVTSA